jgi:hypothetical protein
MPTMINLGDDHHITVQEEPGEVHSGLHSDLFALFTRGKTPVWVSREKVVYFQEAIEPSVDVTS